MEKQNNSLSSGSTGRIGNKLLYELAKKETEIIAITRRHINNLHENVRLLNIDHDEILQNGVLPYGNHIYIVLGTTITQAGSQRELK